MESFPKPICIETEKYKINQNIHTQDHDPALSTLKLHEDLVALLLGRLLGTLVPLLLGRLLGTLVPLLLGRLLGTLVPLLLGREGEGEKREIPDLKILFRV